MTLPLDFILMGEEHVGTGLLHRCLLKHPDMRIPGHEVSFFEESQYRADIAPLRALFPREKRDTECFGIKRPGYLMQSGCAERIYGHYPHIKLVLVLRNPVDRFLSVYFDYMKHGYLPLALPERGLKSLMQGRYTRYPKANELIHFGRYYEGLSQYLGLFKREQIHVLFLEEIIDQPEREMQKLCEFLGVDATFYAQRKLPVVHEKYHSLGETALWSVYHRMFFIQGSNNRLIPRQALLRGEQIGRKITSLLTATLRPYVPSYIPDMSMLSRLKEFYEEDVEKLYAFLGREDDPFGFRL